MRVDTVLSRLALDRRDSRRRRLFRLNRVCHWRTMAVRGLVEISVRGIRENPVGRAVSGLRPEGAKSPKRSPLAAIGKRKSRSKPVTSFMLE